MTIQGIIYSILGVGFWLILGLTLITCVVMLTYENIKSRRKQKLEEYQRLKWHVKEEYDHYLWENELFDEPKNLISYFSDKSNYDKALLISQSILFESQNYHESQIAVLSKEDITKKRQYSYKYEKFVYDIFEPYGKYISDDKWILNYFLPSNYIIKKISEFLRVDINESNILFNEFIDNGLIQRNRDKDEYILGYILYYWDCLSKDDWSFSKWMTYKRNIKIKPNAI